VSHEQDEQLEAEPRATAGPRASSSCKALGFGGVALGLWSSERTLSVALQTGIRQMRVPMSQFFVTAEPRRIF